MRIAFVTQWFPPESGTFIAAAVADGLAERGHHVDVLTGFPNYPTGKLHPGNPLKPYRRDQRSDRVTVHRTPLYPSHDKSPSRRMANYLSFGISASWTARTQLTRPDVWLTYSSPVTAALPAMTVPLRLRAPSFLMMQDLWPDSVTGSGLVSGMPLRAIEKVLNTFCDRSYRSATGIGVISPSMRRVLVERGVPPERIHYTPNWIDDHHLLPDVAPSDELRRSLGLPEGKLFMYAGNMGTFQGLKPLIEAFGLCPDVNLVFVGDGVLRTELRSLVSKMNLRNIHFVGSQPTGKIGSYIAASDVQIVSLQDTGLLRVTMPSKVQTAMAAARPILAHAAGDVVDVVTNSSAGLCASPGDIVGAAEAIRRMAALPSSMLARMGSSGRKYYKEYFSLPTGLDRMEKMLNPYAS